MTKPKKLYVIDEDAGVLDEVQGWFLAQAETRAGSTPSPCANSSTACIAIATIRRNAPAKGDIRPTTMPLTATRRRWPGPFVRWCSTFLLTRRNARAAQKATSTVPSAFTRPAQSDGGQAELELHAQA